MRRIRERFLFLRKLFLRQNRYLIKKNLFVNFFFLKNFLNFYKKKKQIYYKNLFFKTKIDLISVFPAYTINKNVFNKKIKFKDFSIKHNLSLIFLPNSYSNNYDKNFFFGLNYYLIKNSNTNHSLKELESEDFAGLIYFKKNDVIFKNHNFNYYFNYNLHNLCLIELYKIIILLTLLKFKN